MRLIVLWLRRLTVLLLGVLAVWFILFVFRVTDHRLSWIVALAITYALAAYGILPRVVRLGLKILQRRSVPSFTLTGDGFPGGPVNRVLSTGTPGMKRRQQRRAGRHARRNERRTGQPAATAPAPAAPAQPD